ncbi:MAG: ABC-type uncharacterized transport system permease subunit [Cellvibrionaceae bacterium]|jgi:ABC-type uncharacterized transport system permease subunit
MTLIIINLLALVIYLIAGFYQLILIKQEKPQKNNIFLALAALSILCHSAGVYPLIVQNNGIDLEIGNMASLVVLSINVLVFFSSLLRPLQNLFIFLFPLSALAIAFSVFRQEPHFVSVGPEIAAHILLSIIAYSLLAITSLQALLLAWQNYQLKNHHLTGPVKLLPPLQTMERLMFDILRAGVLLLSLAIASGFIFLEDIFAQQLVHKTVLSLLAWLVFVGLLWCRHSFGWCGNLAVKWVLFGFCLLLLAYFGSELVLQILL